MKRSKAYRAAAEKIDADQLYAPLEAIRLVKETTATKFDPTVEVSMPSIGSTASRSSCRRCANG